MFGFNKKEKSLSGVGEGRIITLDKLSDQVFSQKLLGEGFALVPDKGEVFSPVDGIISNISDTNHAYCITAEDGLEILVHVGIDTVELKGEGFSPQVTENQRIKKGELLAHVDLKLIKERGYNTEFIVVITNSEKLKRFQVEEMSMATKDTDVFLYTLLK